MTAEGITAAAPADSSSGQDPHAALIEKIMDAVASAVDSDVTVCTRVWEAWSYGTMGPDDFTPLAEEPDVLRDIANAVVASFEAQP